MKRFLIITSLIFFASAYADPNFAVVARSCLANTQQSHTDMEVIYHAFLNLQNKTVSTTFPSYIAKNITVYKNNHVLNYSTLYNHVYEMTTTSQTIKIFPFDLIFTCGSYAIAKYSIQTYDKQEHPSQTKFISIFKIKDDKISKIWEVATTQGR